jgi:hypothetical protein
MKSTFRIGVCAAVLFGGATLAQERRIGADDGLYFLLGGGVETYTGALAPQLGSGFTYGAHVGYRPTQLFGVELGYSGAAVGLQAQDVGDGLLIEGGDVRRNGVQAAATLGITRTRLQPYVMGGVGFEAYNVRGEGEALGFADGTNGYIPAGGGLRYMIGNFLTADARVSYNLPFLQDLTPDPANALGDGRVQGLLQLGGTF